MTAETWKTRVIALSPAALVLPEWYDMDVLTVTGRTASSARARRFVVRSKVDGDIVGISMVSSADAWRVAYINLTSKRPPDEGAGTQLLL